MKAGTRIVATLVAVNSVVFALLFALALAGFAPDRVIPRFALRWELTEALLGLARWLPATQFFAIALALGTASGDGDTLFRAAMPHAAISAIFLSSIVLIAAPGLEATRSRALGLSERFNRSLGLARTALERGDLQTARALVDTLEAIDRRDERVARLDENLRGAEIKTHRNASSSSAISATRAVSAQAAETVPDKAAARQYYLKALDFFAKGDFFSAHWYASRAALVDTSIPEAKRLAARSWEALTARGGEVADPAAARLQRRKLEAYGLLRSGDAISAFREFSALAREAPGDLDVKRYLAESERDLAQAAFFKDESDRAAAVSLPRFFAILPSEDGVLRALAAASASFTSEAVYFTDFEYLEATPLASGEGRTRKIAAPYAKLIERRALLVAVERARPETVYRALDSTTQDGHAPTWVELPLDPETAYRVAAAHRAPAALGVLDAYAAAAEAPRYGLDPGPIQRDLLARLGLPFALLSASAIGILLGIRFRAPGAGARHSWISLPFMAATTAAVFAGLAQADDAVSALALRLAPWPAALGAAAGIKAATLLAAVLIATGFREERAGFVPQHQGAGSSTQDDAYED